MATIPYAGQPGPGDPSPEAPDGLAADADTAPVDGIQILPVRGLPEVAQGDDLALLIQSCCAATLLALRPGDVVVVSSKILSKAMGLWADTRVEAISRSTVRVVAERATFEGLTQVVEAVAGPVMAAGGVDASNTGGAEGVLLLPDDPDAAAAALLDRLLQLTGLAAGSLGLIVTDTAGRPWRSGQTDFALGAAGVLVLDDLRGSVDADGRPLAVTSRALADEIAAAADLVKGKASAVPVAIVRGLGALVSPTSSVASGAPVASVTRAAAVSPVASVAPAAPVAPVAPMADEPTMLRGARSLVRTGPSDWFRMGHLEAVRAALGVEPGSAQSLAVGLHPLHHEQLADRIGRVLRLGVSGWTDAVTAHADGATITLRAADEFALGAVAARLTVSAWTENLALTTDHLPSDPSTADGAVGRVDRVVRLSVTDLAPPTAPVAD